MSVITELGLRISAALMIVYGIDMMMHKTGFTIVCAGVATLLITHWLFSDKTKERADVDDDA